MNAKRKTTSGKVPLMRYEEIYTWRVLADTSGVMWDWPLRATVRQDWSHGQLLWRAHLNLLNALHYEPWKRHYSGVSWSIFLSNFILYFPHAVIIIFYRFAIRSTSVWIILLWASNIWHRFVWTSSQKSSFKQFDVKKTTCILLQAKIHLIIYSPLCLLANIILKRGFSK